ncbi:MAG: Subtilisin-like serine protease [Chthonomonadaceae bacterium]|nr:Subtilisin-like serine protease [Chthonomonadaceae bacterium]
MGEKSGSRGLRWMSALLLAAAATPTLLTWRQEAKEQALPAPPPAVTSEWIDTNALEVQMRPGTTSDDLADLGKKLNLSLHWNSEVSQQETDVADADVPIGVDPNAELTALRADPRVEAADVVHFFHTPQDEMVAPHPDDLTAIPTEDSNRWKPNDPRYGEQWNFQMVKAEEAWESTKGKGAIVAVIDTGVAYADTKKGKRAKDFGDTKFVPGYDFVNHDSFPNDDQGHGTHVSGTIAESTDNGEGVAGLAFECKIMPLKVLSASGSGSSRDIAEAIRWAADHGANVINMSLGGPFPDDVTKSACAYAKKKGVAIICAAGNSGREGVGYPAAYPDCIAVSAVGPDGKLSFYSTYGKQIALAAPGGDKQKGGDAGGILQNTTMPDENGAMQDDYYSFQGTSMATPHVAAVAALIVSQGVKDPDEIKSILQKSATRTDGPKTQYGAGILNAASAAKMAGNEAGDATLRLWLVVALYAGCFFIGKARQKSGTRNAYPFWGTTALAIGLLLPQWLTHFLGNASPWNLVAHSILVPGALLLLGADKTEKRILGWLAFGMTVTIGMEFLHGTTPLGAEIGAWQLLPWVAVNGLVGLGMLFAGLSANRD